MRIALALADQAKARLDLVRYGLWQSRIRAPFNGVVVEGDLRQRIGAPVKQGEALFRIARLEPMYVEAEINERDVRDIIDKSGGEIAFVARPKQKYKIRVVRVEPAAIAKEKQNVFLARCIPEHQPELWSRPGMSGVCKIDVDRRTLLWILTHRTVDFLRMYLWW
ncbi:MAG: HlyD family efflux transporter periplasmic adaptor subunit [Verrucomicrobiota bacterium]|nr:HlyD family efflux transporter periplasmic adaptor subunit [Verrucomicrobiota bacterium]